MATPARPGSDRSPFARRLAWLAVAACGIGHGAAMPAQAATHTVEIRAMQFTPPALEVRPGDTVVWINKDAFPHNVTAGSGSFRSPELASGASWKWKAARPGSFSYLCTLHPTMKASITVSAR